MEKTERKLEPLAYWFREDNKIMYFKYANVIIAISELPNGETKIYTDSGIINALMHGAEPIDENNKNELGEEIIKFAKYITKEDFNDIKSEISFLGENGVDESQEIITLREWGLI